MKYKDYLKEHNNVLEPINEIIGDTITIGQMMALAEQLWDVNTAEKIKKFLEKTREEYLNMEVKKE